jgi:hypothetical protein
MNIALIKEGILRELAMDFTDVADRGALKRLAAIYGINAFIYGTGNAYLGLGTRLVFTAGPVLLGRISAGGEIPLSDSFILTPELALVVYPFNPFEMPSNIGIGFTGSVPIKY